MRKIRRQLILSDTHVGSTVGLWPESHLGGDGNPLGANKYQMWLLQCWAAMKEEAERLKVDTITINGDIIQGVNNRDGQLVTNLIDVQQSAAEALFSPLCKPVLKRGGHVNVIRGTEWHEGKASEDVELLARELGATQDPDTGQYSRWELYQDMGGDGYPVVHFAHHIQTSGNPAYESTVPLRDALTQLTELARFYGATAPRVRCVVRSHRHRFVHVQAPPDIQVFVTPSWQLKTAFAHKKATSMLPQIGYVLLEWDGTDLVVKPRIFPLPGIRVEAF